MAITIALNPVNPFVAMADALLFLFVPGTFAELLQTRREGGHLLF
jgi:hypothetical protein